MRLFKKIIVGVGIIAMSWTTTGVNAQTSQPVDDAAAPFLSLKEQADAQRNFQSQFDNPADLQRALQLRQMAELGSRLGLTAAQEAKISSEMNQTGGVRFDMPIPMLLENGSRDPKLPHGETLNNDCRISWLAWVALVEAVDDPATPVDVLRSRIKSWQDADTTARADRMAIQRRITQELTARQIALYPAISLLGDTRWASFKGYAQDKNAKTSLMMSQGGASSSNAYGIVPVGIHKAIQSVLKMDDDEYAVLKPRVDAVCLARAKTSGSCAQFARIKDKGGHISDLADMNYDGILGVLVELDAAVRNPDTTEEVFAQEEAELTTAVQKALKDFNKAEDDLRSVLTTRQEAIMILEDVLQ
jgi:hypothetical protein